jgi:hypothetical protein
VGIALMAGGSVYVGGLIDKWSIVKGGYYPHAVAALGAGSLISSITNIEPKNKSILDPFLNLREKDNSSSNQTREIKTNLNFNNLTTE